MRRPHRDASMILVYDVIDSYLVMYVALVPAAVKAEMLRKVCDFVGREME